MRRVRLSSALSKGIARGPVQFCLEPWPLSQCRSSRPPHLRGRDMALSLRQENESHVASGEKSFGTSRGGSSSELAAQVVCDTVARPGRALTPGGRGQGQVSRGLDLDSPRAWLAPQEMLPWPQTGTWQ